MNYLLSFRGRINRAKYWLLILLEIVVGTLGFWVWGVNPSVFATTGSGLPIHADFGLDGDRNA
jgi:uncharacterized membrane protein YhaH (DUF805 family)